VAARQQSLQESRRAFTHARLIDAARAAFEAKGYVDTTIDDITARAGASRATFYLYFPSKAALYDDVASDFAEDYAVIKENFRQLKAPRTLANLEDWLRSYVELIRKHRPLVRALLQAQAVEPELTHRSVQNILYHADWWVEEGIVAKPDSDDPQWSVRQLMLGLQMQAFVKVWIIDEFAVEDDLAIRMLADTWYEQLYNKKPRRSSAR
jgi:AcrR family transcriptional regulator